MKHLEKCIHAGYNFISDLTFRPYALCGDL